MRRRGALAVVMVATGCILLAVGAGLYYLPFGLAVAGGALLIFGLIGVEVP